MNHKVARFMTFFVHLHSYQKLLQAIGNYQVRKRKRTKIAENPVTSFMLQLASSSLGDVFM